MDVSDLIRQNPVLTVVITIVPVIGAMWKVFHELYVKPRDLRIDYLKEDMARLKGELDDLRVAQSEVSARQPSTLPHASIQSPVSGLAPMNTASPQLELPSPKGTASDSVADVASQAPSSRPASIEMSAQHDPATSPSPLTSLRECYEQWKTRSFTELQKKRYEKDHVGKSIDWDVWVESVMPPAHGRIGVSVRDERTDLDSPRAIAYFEERFENELLALGKGDQINLRGTLREFFLWPTVDGTAIRKIPTES